MGFFFTLCSEKYQNFWRCAKFCECVFSKWSIHNDSLVNYQRARQASGFYWNKVRITHLYDFRLHITTAKKEKKSQNGIICPTTAQDLTTVSIHSRNRLK